MRDLARILGVSYGLVGFYERGERRVPVDVLYTLSEIGGVSLDWLVTGEDGLRKREPGERYENLFEDSPISLWEEDCSQAKKYLDSLRQRGIDDFEAYFEDHPEAVGYCLALVKITDVNQTTVQLFQAQNKEEIIREPHRIFTEDSLDCFRSNLVAMAAGQPVFESETTIKTAKGEKLYISLRWAVAPGFEESFARVFVSMVDITKLKKAEEELRLDQALFNALMDTMPDLIYFKDLKSRFIKASKASAMAVGLQDTNELIGRTDFDFYPEERAREFFEDERRIIDRGVPVVNKIERQSLPGFLEWTSTTKMPLRDQQERVIGIVGISRVMEWSAADPERD